MSQSIKPPRLLVIGLDGATFDLLEPMATQGWLPNLSHVLADSARGVLRSTVPPLTAPAWTSFQTGLRPGSHGVFSFQRRLDATLEREFVNSTAIHGPRLWHWLARHGLTTGVVNLPMTWPPLPMPAGSYVVTGMETPDTSVPFTDPPELADELRAMNYVCDLRVKLHERDFRSAAGVTSIARDLLEVLRLREQAVFKLLAERPTDALVVVFETPDRLQRWACAVEQLLHNNGGLERTPLHEVSRAC
ncbi:MAG: alkaline phosphatase family protein [Anaerolineales bacterium]|nr:alkaline phosphatase family protein [Anaerolineales bacterium]